MEDVLDGVKAYFDANLVTTLVAIETARSVTIPRIAGDITVRTDLSMQYPMMSIIPRSAEHDYGDDEGPLEDHWTFFNVDVVITHSGSAYDTVQDALLRYYEAIVDLTQSDWTYGSRFDRVRLGDADFSVMIESQEDKRLMQSLIIALEVRVYDH